MSPTLVQAASTTLTSGASVTPTALATQPTAGNLLLIVMGIMKSTATVITPTAPAGWSHIVTPNGTVDGASSGSIAILGRIATGVAGAGTGTGTSQTGGDDPPVIAMGASSTAVAIYMEEWPGSGAGNIDTSSFPDASAAVASNTLTTGVTGNTLTVAGANEWCYVVLGGRANFTSLVWGGSLNVEQGVLGSTGGQVTTATQLLSAGSITPSPTFTNSRATPVNAIASFAFKTFAGTTPISLADSGAATDALSTTATTPLAETAAGTDSLATTATAPLADTSAGTDAITVAATAPLGDTATGAEALTTAATAPLVETATATDTLSTAATAPTLADSATATDALSVTVRISLSDSATGTDALGTAAFIALAELGTFTDQLGTIAHVAFVDTGALVDEMHVIEPARDVTIMAGPTTTSYASGPTATSYGTGPTATRYATGPTVS